MLGLVELRRNRQIANKSSRKPAKAHVSEGEKIVHVQKILSHSQISTTAEHVKVAIGDLMKVVERKHPREKQYRRKK